jgi:hypothetical protein
MTMLKEIQNTRQEADQPPRRFFFSHEQDLWVWFGEGGEPVGFQLAYGKYRNEHAIRWKADRGFVHHRVDDGESAGALAKAAPILLADGVFDAAAVLERFLELSAEMPPEIVDFVAARLREHPEFRATSPPSP